jgi:hypothetical protein
MPSVRDVSRESHVSVDLLSSLKDFFRARVTHIMPEALSQPIALSIERFSDEYVGDLPTAKTTPNPTTTP